MSKTMVEGSAHAESQPDCDGSTNAESQTPGDGSAGAGYPARRSTRPGRAALSSFTMAACLLTRAASAQPTAPPLTTTTTPPPPDELRELEKALAADKAAAAQATPPSAPGVPAVVSQAGASANLALAFIADFALAAFSKDENLQTGGHDPKENGFNLQALELSASADVDPYFKFDANIVFGEEVEIEEAYATTLALPGSLQIRAGQFLTRFGRVNATHPHRWDFVDQPLVIGKMLGPDGNRGLGVEVSWLTPLPWYVELVGSLTQATGACCARSFYGDDNPGVRGPQDLEAVLALKQFHALSDDWSLATGLSAALGPNPSSRDAETTLLGADLYLKYRPISRESSTVVSLQAEAITRRRDSPTGTLSDTGLYAQLFYRFAPRWATAARYDFGSGVVADPLDPAWTSARHRGSAELTFYPTEFSRLRLQGSADAPSPHATPIYAAFLALEVAVGAHGAHQF